MPVIARYRGTASGTLRRTVAGVRGTAALARALACLLGERSRCGLASVVALEGDLGVGKTTFIRHVAVALGVDRGCVTSPTFSLINVYRGSVVVHHIDLYRIGSARELAGLDLEDILSEPGAVVLVEWPVVARELLPTDVIHVTLSFVAGAPARRVIRIWPWSVAQCSRRRRGPHTR